MTRAEKRAAREAARPRSEATKAGWADHKGGRSWIREAQRVLAAEARGEDRPESTINEAGYVEYSTAWDADWEEVIDRREYSARKAAKLAGDLLAAPEYVGVIYDPALRDHVDVRHPNATAVVWLFQGPEQAFLAMCACEARR